ncbi:MAG: class I SAM-dependent methyltransferase [Kofleriaceae bacterium]
MTTLTTGPVPALLKRLFADSDASDAKMREWFKNVSPEERTKRMSDPNSDYRGFYNRMNELYLAVSEDTARLLYMLGRATKATAIVEFGTSFGISTIHLAAALKDNGGGRLIGSDLEPGKVARAKANLAEAGLLELCDIREGDALQTLSHDLPETIDLVLMDGHKPLYSKILTMLEPRLRVGTMLVADNVEAAPEYLARVRDPQGTYTSVPFSDEVEVTVKTK